MGNYAEAKADLDIATRIQPDDLVLREELRHVDEKMHGAQQHSD